MQQSISIRHIRLEAGDAQTISVQEDLTPSLCGSSEVESLAFRRRDVPRSRWSVAASNSEIVARRLISATMSWRMDFRTVEIRTCRCMLMQGRHRV